MNRSLLMFVGFVLAVQAYAEDCIQRTGKTPLCVGDDIITKGGDGSMQLSGTIEKVQPGEREDITIYVRDDIARIGYISPTRVSSASVFKGVREYGKFSLGNEVLVNWSEKGKKLELVGNIDRLFENGFSLIWVQTQLFDGMFAPVGHYVSELAKAIPTSNGIKKGDHVIKMWSGKGKQSENYGGVNEVYDNGKMWVFFQGAGHKIVDQKSAIKTVQSLKGFKVGDQLETTISDDGEKLTVQGTIDEIYDNGTVVFSTNITQKDGWKVQYHPTQRSKIDRVTHI